MKNVIVSAAFDNLTSRAMRFLEEAAKLGELQVLLWSDAAIRNITGADPTLPLAEREYFVQAIRYVSRLQVSATTLDPDTLPALDGCRPDIWCVDEHSASAAKAAFCAAHGIAYRRLSASQCAGFPTPAPLPLTSRKKVMVTGCYDWFHTGHVRFFEEVSELGDLFVVVGHDANIRLLKGNSHPLFSENERRYSVGSIRYVTQALISSGTGWLDAEPEIARIQPDRYAVNEDGDKPEKRAFCEQHGIEYVVLKRSPKPGLARRSSTDLRGF